MTYTVEVEEFKSGYLAITKHTKIEHEEDGWSFDFTADEYGTVSVKDEYQTIHIPKDCIQHFINVLEQYK